MQYTIYYNLQINTVVKLEIVLTEPDMLEPQYIFGFVIDVGISRHLKMAEM
jgi:hypothetical protein